MWLTDWFRKSKQERRANNRRPRILVLRMPLSDLFQLERLGKQHAWELRFTTSPGEGFRLVSQSHFEVILCDCNQPGYPWREVIDRLAASSPRSRILLVSPVSDDYLRRDVLRQGGCDVLVRPLREESLRTVQAVLRYGSPRDDTS